MAYPQKRSDWRKSSLRAAFLCGYLGTAAPVFAQLPPLPGPAPAVPAAPDSQPAPRQLVADVEVKGLSSTKDYQAQKHIQTRKDREFDPEIVQGDVRRLMATGLFRDVRTYTKPASDGVIVIYEVFERPRVQYIRHLGNRGMSEKKLSQEHGIKIGDALNAYSCEEGRRRIEEVYHRNGFPNAQVSLMEGDKPGDKGVVYLINEGHIERIADVAFEGNVIANDGRLKTQIESKPGFLWYFFKGKVDRQKIDADVEKLTAYYRSLGYFRARVGRELEFDESGKWLTIKFIIDEGPRYKVRNVTIEGNQKFASQPLLDFLELKSGEHFNQAEMNKDINTLIDLYGSQGHVFADVQADPRFLEEPGTLDLVYRVKEGDVFRVGEVNVHIAGEFPHTRDSVVLNRLSLRPGDIIDMREIRASERRLKASQLFETNPAEGEPPKIVVRPPDLNSISAASGTAVRGQSPDESDEVKNYYQPSPAMPQQPVPHPNMPQQPVPHPNMPQQPVPHPNMPQQPGAHHSVLPNAPSTLYSWNGSQAPQPGAPQAAPYGTAQFSPPPGSTSMPANPPPQSWQTPPARY